MQQTYPPRSAVISWIFFAWAAEPFFTLITTFVFAPYFATHVASDPASGPIAVGLCDRGGGTDDRAAVAGAGRDRGRQRPPQALDRGVRRDAGDRRLADVVWQARRPRRHSAIAARLRRGDRRRRIRHRLQQFDDADAGAAGPDRAIVGDRLGHRLCRRHPQPHPGARLSRRQPRDRPHAVRLHAVVRARSRHPSGRSHHRSADRHLVHRLRAADVFADAGLSRQASGARSPARGIDGFAANACRIAEAAIDGGVPACQYDLHRRAGVAVCVRRHLRRRHLWLEHDPDRQLRHYPGRSPAPSAHGLAASSTILWGRNG